jgi:hypothetical protein
MLQAMQQPGSANVPSPNASSFAGLLAALATPAPKGSSVWNDDDLADDVATLSYERALRAHARYHSEGPTDQSLTESLHQAFNRATEPIPVPASLPIRNPSASSAGSAAVSRPEPASAPGMQPETTHFPLGRDLKCASITIRMSEAECAQLRQRAAEAGLTISAYLRSCTFEAESLRAMVRDTLAQVRSATNGTPRPAISDPSHRSGMRKSWFRRLAAWLAHPKTAGQANRDAA